jgi:RNA polymerase sigma-70 factor (ECF subfamily)
LEILRGALARLNDEQQSLLILRFIERKSHEQVAEIMGKSLSAVKSIQHRALQQ